jgi:hypothetical protein
MLRGDLEIALSKVHPEHGAHGRIVVDDQYVARH